MMFLRGDNDKCHVLAGTIRLKHGKETFFSNHTPSRTALSLFAQRYIFFLKVEWLKNLPPVNNFKPVPCLVYFCKKTKKII
jgi:hypothetical protein